MNDNQRRKKMGYRALRARIEELEASLSHRNEEWQQVSDAFIQQQNLRRDDGARIEALEGALRRAETALARHSSEVAELNCDAWALVDTSILAEVRAALAPSTPPPAPEAPEMPEEMDAYTANGGLPSHVTDDGKVHRGRRPGCHLCQPRETHGN